MKITRIIKKILMLIIMLFVFSILKNINIDFKKAQKENNHNNRIMDEDAIMRIRK